MPTASEVKLFRLPEEMSLEMGAMMEPLSVAVYACKRGEVSLGSRVFILGAGPVGVISMMVAKVMGATEVVITGKCSKKCFNSRRKKRIFFSYRMRNPFAVT